MAPPNSAEAEAAQELLTRYYTNRRQSICTVDQSKLSEILKDSDQTGLSPSRLEKTIAASKVIVVGEIHLYTDLQGRLELIRAFRKIKGPGACIGFEWPKRRGGLNEIIRMLQKMSDHDRKIGGKNLIRAQNIERMISYYKPMGMVTDQLKLKSVTFDHPDRFEKDLSMDERNHAMSDNISELISKRKCSSILLFVGKDHMAESEDSSTSLPDLIRKKSIRTISLNLQMSRENSVPAAAKSWSGCKPPIHDRSLFFESSNIPDDPKLFSETKNPIRWKDFDFTYLLP